MQNENPTWTAQRIQGELVKLGLSVCDNTVAKYMRKPKTGPEKIQRWLTFLRNHAKYTVCTCQAIVGPLKIVNFIANVLWKMNNSTDVL